MSNTFKSLVLGNITGIAAVISALVYFPVLMNVAFDTFPKNDAWTVIAIFGGLLVYGLEGLFMYILSILPISILYI